MTLIFIAINIVTEYKSGASAALRGAMLSFEAIYFILEAICAVMAYFYINPVGNLVTIKPKPKLIILGFAELTILVIDLGILMNFLIVHVSSTAAFVGLEILQVSCGILGAIIHWAARHY